MKRSLVVTVTLILASAGGAAAQPKLELSAKVLDALLQARAASDNIDRVGSILREVDSGRQPESPGSLGQDWSSLASGYRRAAAALDSAEGVAAFDASQYTVSAADLQCPNRPQGLARLRQYADALDQAVAKGKDNLRRLAIETERADSSASALRYLIRVSQDATKVPIIGQLFAWDWFAMQAAVSPAIGDYRQALGRHERKLSEAIRDTERHSGNLRNNIGLIPSGPCPPPAHPAAGTYRGTANNQQHTFTINPNGTSGTWVVNFPSAAGGGSSRWRFNNLRISSGTITFTTVMDGTNYVGTKTGTISSDYRTITINPPGRVVLSR